MNKIIKIIEEEKQKIFQITQEKLGIKIEILTEGKIRNYATNILPIKELYKGNDDAWWKKEGARIFREILEVLNGLDKAKSYRQKDNLIEADTLIKLSLIAWDGIKRKLPHVKANPKAGQKKKGKTKANPEEVKKYVKAESLKSDPSEAITKAQKKYKYKSKKSVYNCLNKV